MWLAFHKPVSLRNSKVLFAINEHHGKWVVLNFKASVCKSWLFRLQCSFHLQNFPVLISLSILPIHTLLRFSLYKRICVFVLLFPVYRSPFHAAIPLSVQSSAYGTVCVLHRVIQGEISTFWEVIVPVIVRGKKVYLNMCVYHQSSAYGTVCVLHRVIQGEMSKCWEVTVSVIVRKKKVHMNMCLYQSHQNNLTPKLNIKQTTKILNGQRDRAD